MGFDPTFTGSGASHRGGSVPDPGSSAGTTRFLCEDATFRAVPFVGGALEATITADGTPVVGTPLTLATLTPPAGKYKVAATVDASASIGPGAVAIRVRVGGTVYAGAEAYVTTDGAVSFGTPDRVITVGGTDVITLDVSIAADGIIIRGETLLGGISPAGSLVAIAVALS